MIVQHGAVLYSQLHKYLFTLSTYHNSLSEGVRCPKGLQERTDLLGP
jgi:hypothetical protein